MNIKGYDMSMIRGDSETITIGCQDVNNAEIPFEVGDKVYFSVKERVSDTEYAVQKVVDIFENGKAIIEIQSADTRRLAMNRDYYYDIRLVKSNGAVTTLVPMSKFRLEGEITVE